MFEDTGKGGSSKGLSKEREEEIESIVQSQFEQNKQNHILKLFSPHPFHSSFISISLPQKGYPLKILNILPIVTQIYHVTTFSS